MNMEYREETGEDPVSVMREAMTRVDNMPQEIMAPAGIMAMMDHRIVEMVSQLIEHVKNSQQGRPEEIPQDAGEAIVFTNAVTVLVSAVLIAARAMAEGEKLGCFRPKMTVEGPRRDPDFVDMTTTEINKLLGLDQDLEMN